MDGFFLRNINNGYSRGLNLGYHNLSLTELAAVPQHRCNRKQQLESNPPALHYFDEL